MLQVIFLDNSMVVDLSPLTGLTGLRLLNLSGTPERWNPEAVCFDESSKEGSSDTSRAREPVEQHLVSRDDRSAGPYHLHPTVVGRIYMMRASELIIPG
jgi:hypothetical protein